jgi:SAM-dependent methyltransferase
VALDYYDPDIYDLEEEDAYGKKRRAEFYSNEATRINGPILELGCGTGNILLAVARQGIHVTGLDISAPMLDRAAMKIAKESQEIQSRIKIVQGDMEEIELPEKFSGIFIPYHAIFHLTSPEALGKCLRKIFAHLAPSGELIFDIFVDPIKFVQVSGTRVFGFRPVGEVMLPEGICQVYAQCDYDVITQRLTGTYRYELVNSNREVIKTWYRTLPYRVPTPEEIRLHLLLCGFSEIEMWGAFERENELDPARDIIIQAKKILSRA